MCIRDRLRDIQELSAPEAAAQLGISLDALKSRLHRARVRLRDQVLRRERASAFTISSSSR